MIPRYTQTPVAFQKACVPPSGGTLKASLASPQFGLFGWFEKKKKEDDSLESQLKNRGPQAWKSFKWGVLSGGVGILSGIAGFFFPPLWGISLAAGLGVAYSGYKIWKALPSAQMLQAMALQQTAHQMSSDPEQQQKIEKDLLQDLETLYQLPSKPKAPKREKMMLGFEYIFHWGQLASPFIGTRMLSMFQQNDHQLKISLANLETAASHIKDSISKEMAETRRHYGTKTEVSLPEAYAIARQWMKAWVQNLPKE